MFRASPGVVEALTVAPHVGIAGRVGVPRAGLRIRKRRQDLGPDAVTAGGSGNLAEAGTTIGAAVFLADMLSIQLMIRPAILLPVHLPILLPICPAILLSVFPAIVLPVLLPVGTTIFLANVELCKGDRRDHRWRRDGHNQAGDQSGF